ncbi:MAG: PAS domain S-box protein [Magnetovibrio sp.]|nr:PAS domain S-box protein [Magnetovibrio sp.]
MRIGPLIFAILVLVLATTSGAIMYTSFSAAREQIREEVQRSFEQSRVSALSAFWDEMTFLSSTVDLVSRDRNLGDLVRNGNWETTEEYLYDALLGVSDRLDLLLILDANGRVVGNAGSSIDGVDVIARQTLPYLNVKSWFSVGETEKSLVRVVPIIYQKTGQVVGHLIYGISLWGNIRFANDIRRVTGSDRVELKVDGIFQASAPVSRQSILLQPGGGLAAYAKNTVIELGEHTIAFIAPLRFSQAALIEVVFMSDDTAFKGLAASFKRSLTIQFVVVLVGSTVVLALLMWLVVNPARKMSRYAMSVVEGGAEVAFEPSMIEEFNTMGRVVNGVFKDLQRSNFDLTELKDSLQDRIDRRTASLRAEVEIRRQAESDLRKLALAVEQSPTMIFITDLNGFVEYINAQFCELTQYEADEVIGQEASILRSPDTPQDVYEDMWTTVFKGQEWRAEIRVRKKDDGEFWSNASVAPVSDAAGNITHFVAMHEDISERKQAEQQMREAKRTAELANRAKSELMANMSHELRTPLNAILGFSSTMQTKIFGPLGHEKYDDYVGYIFDSGSHLLDLINDILDVSAIEAGKFELHEEAIDLALICDSCQQIIQSRVDDGGVILVWPNCDGLPQVLVDVRRMKQILLNLLSNAVKFTPRDGRITCGAHVDESGFVITVADTGIGMDADGILKAMSQFGQVDSSLSRKHDGTGLGLPLTKSLVELHGGTFVISSQKHVGTKITITLPRNRILAVEGVGEFTHSA